MDLRTYHFVLRGLTPLILHHDDVDWADYIDAWRADPANKPYQKKRGDDRVPGFLWVGSLYHDDTHIALPAANLHRALRDGAARISTGKRTETFKRQSQSGMAPAEAFLPIAAGDEQPVPYAPIAALVERQEHTFLATREVARQCGFDLLVKRVPVGMTKHVRVRPVFPRWSIQGTMQVWDDTITPQVLEQMFLLTGHLVGLGDWRPAAPSAPGSYGRFEAELTAVR